MIVAAGAVGGLALMLSQVFSTQARPGLFVIGMLVAFVSAVAFSDRVGGR